MVSVVVGCYSTNSDEFDHVLGAGLNISRDSASGKINIDWSTIADEISLPPPHHRPALGGQEATFSGFLSLEKLEKIEMFI